MHKRNTKITKIAFSVILFFAFPIVNFASSKVINNTSRSILHITKAQSDLSEQLGRVAPGNHIQFGHYEQDANLFNGAEKIDWIVLAKDESSKKATLISLFILDCARFNGTEEKATWDISSLRNYLNNEMIYELFDEDEMHCIALSHIENLPNPYYGTYCGEATDDKLYIPSIDDIYTYLSVKDLPEDERWTELMNHNLLRSAIATDYAISRGVRVTDFNSKLPKRGNYFLRTAGLNSHRKWFGDTYADHYQSFISEIGELKPSGTGINSNDDGIRIMMQVYY